MVKIIGNFEVDDWVHWKKMFDQHSNAREAAGIKTIYVGNEIENTNKVHIVMETPAADTCLLYTSPSPRDLSTSRMPSSA